MSMFKNLERVAMKELETLDSKYEGKNEFTKDDAELFRCLSHGWKCLLTAEAMHEAKDTSMSEGMSYRNQPRNMYNGQYMSHEIGDGWSGHYGPNWYNMPGYRPEERRWY